MPETDLNEAELRIKLKTHIARLLQNEGKLPLVFLVNETVTAMIKDIEEYKNGRN
jgi:hypothetical protein